MAVKLCLLSLVMPALFLYQGVSSSAAPSDVARAKRSDGTSPLVVVVDQLSQQVSTINAELTALKARAAKQEASVAFHVWHNTNPLTAGPLKTLIMNHVLTNIGQGYDVLTGVFTVPRSGLYDFQLSFMPYVATTKKVYAGIYVDNARVAEGVADSQHGYWDQSTIRAIVHVTSGQRVYVKNVSNAATYAYFTSSGLPYTSFSGFLVKAD